MTLDTRLKKLEEAAPPIPEAVDPVDAEAVLDAIIDGMPDYTRRPFLETVAFLETAPRLPNGDRDYSRWDYDRANRRMWDLIRPYLPNHGYSVDGA